jgi:N-sulfoglucosamine sulfohydrolase
MFLSDNGMAVPFAKANCYLHSTRTPWIVRWPGRVKPGTVDADHLISGIDFMPTMLEALGLEPPEGMDGRSFLPILRGGKQAGRDYAFTEFHMTFARRCFPMRAVHDRRFGYLVNFWAGRTKPMRMDSTSGRTFRAMLEAGKTDPAVASRVALFEHRVLEEFYDFEKDPHALKNLIADPAYRDAIRRLRAALENRMARTGDPALHAFRHRDDPAALDAFMSEQRAKAAKR